MPYVKKTNADGKVCVYKKGDNGEATGESLGCHDSESKADDQIAALYASEQDNERETFLSGVVGRLREWLGLKQTRALSSQRLFSQISVVLDQFQPQPDENGEYPVDSQWLTPIDLYIDQGQMYLVVTKAGKLYRSDVSVNNDIVSLGALSEVTESHPAVTQSRCQVIRTADGPTRWLSICATAVLNRSGCIDSRSLFDSFVAHIERTKEYPVLDFYHVELSSGEHIRFGVADLVARDDAVYIAAGTFDDTEIGRAAADALENDKDGYWGTSISFLPTEPPQSVEVAQDVKVPVYTQGVNRFISILPEARAASLFTTIAAQEVTRMKKETYDALVKLVGEERAKKFAEEADATNREIASEGLITRQADGTAQEQTTEPDQSQDAAALTFELSDDDVKEIAEQARALSADDIKSVKDAVEAMQKVLNEVSNKLSEQEKKDEKALAELGARLDALEQTDDEKRARWQADLPKPRTVTITRPSQARANTEDTEVAAPQRAEDTLAQMKTRKTGV